MSRIECPYPGFSRTYESNANYKSWSTAGASIYDKKYDKFELIYAGINLIFNLGRSFLAHTN